MSLIDTVSQQIKKGGIIAIFRGDYSLELILRMADALLEGHVNIMEITLNSPLALRALPKLRDHFEADMLIGAGTVRNKNQAQQARDTGAQFLVSPNLDLETVSFVQSQGLLHIPGVFTSTEIQRASAAGCRMLKLFPMDGLANGVAYLKAIRAPFDDVDFVPTGGISLENIADYAHAGAIAVGLGSKLVGKQSQPLSELTARAQALRNAWDQAKHV
jgi:2-dehydro-3-deoxyphosphogluconate aldolase/(4S)-4-hydroxy-2-oxoglutarate aldolase